MAWYGGPASAVGAPSFSISASAAGLAPGIQTELPVTLGNPSGQPITVSRVRVTAASAAVTASLGAGLTALARRRRAGGMRRALA